MLSGKPRPCLIMKINTWSLKKILCCPIWSIIQGLFAPSKILAYSFLPDIFLWLWCEFTILICEMKIFWKLLGEAKNPMGHSLVRKMWCWSLFPRKWHAKKILSKINGASGAYKLKWPQSRKQSRRQTRYFH